MPTSHRSQGPPFIFMVLAGRKGRHQRVEIFFGNTDHCKTLAPLWSEAALRNEDPNVEFLQVECSKNMKLCRKADVSRLIFGDPTDLIERYLYNYYYQKNKLKYRSSLLQLHRHVTASKAMKTTASTLRKIDSVPQII